MFAYGVIDTYYRPDLTLKEAIELGIVIKNKIKGKRAIVHATYRDAGSGGSVRSTEFFLN